MQEPSNLSEAAVIIIISGELGQERVLLTERSQCLREHAGEIAFPGGKRENHDTDLYATALRECHEEVGLEPDLLAKHSELRPHHTRQGMAVTPFVAKVSGTPSLNLNEGEIASVMWVPLEIFLNDKRSCTHIFKASDQDYWAPVYSYKHYEIWGFTARVLVSFVNDCYQAKLSRAHKTAPEVLYV